MKYKTIKSKFVFYDNKAKGKLYQFIFLNYWVYKEHVKNCVVLYKSKHIKQYKYY